MTSTYRQTALANLGEECAPLLDAIAEKLHHNESPHLHDATPEVDFYCWHRAELAVAALREHDHRHVVITDDAPAQDQVPFGWALWRPDGVLHGYVRADQVTFTNGWGAVYEYYADAVPGWQHQGWNVDPVSEENYTSLRIHSIFFNRPGSREEFLTETKAADQRDADGLPPIVGYAAWGPTGELIAMHGAVRGLNGWHSLGIGNHADYVALDALGTEEHQHLAEHGDFYRVPGGRADFHNWRRRDELTDEQADTNFSSLAHAFSAVISDHSDNDYSGTPGLVLGQYLENCLSAYGGALQARGEYEG